MGAISVDPERRPDRFANSHFGREGLMKKCAEGCGCGKHAGQSDETRAKISAAKRGTRFGGAMKGRPKSPEHRAKIAAGNRGKIISPEQRARMAVSAVEHGHYLGNRPSPTYNSWQGMIARCARRPGYADRGISVSERWRTSFATFLADMGERPEGRTLDRIDNDGNYEPGNCRWATPSEQQQNTRRNKPRREFAISAAVTPG
jgi:hypothetical protein